MTVEEPLAVAVDDDGGPLRPAMAVLLGLVGHGELEVVDDPGVEAQPIADLLDAAASVSD